MSLFAKFASVGGATAASRVLGFVREALIAAFLGAGPVADAFYAAFRFPNLFRRLFAEGAFNSAFIPMFARELETGGRDAARDFAEKILSVLLLILLLLSGFAMIFMPWLVGTVVAPKFASDPEKFDLTVLLTRIMFPYLAAMSVVAMLSGILNAFRRYLLAALAPVVLNIVLISVIVLGGVWELSQADLGILMAWGVVASGFLQLGFLCIGIYREGFPIGFRLPRLSPAVKRLLALALPTAIAGGITQINLLVGQIIASAQSGAIAVMNYADRIMQLPLGIVGISIGVVLLPELTRALAGNNRGQAMELQNQSIIFGLGLTLPAAVGLFMIPEPLVALVFERGAFVRETTILTAQVLAAFAVGLPSFVLIKVLQPSFYAREDMKTPMWYSGINAVTNIVLSLLLFPVYGVVGLAIATSVAGWVNAVLLWGTLLFSSHFELTKLTVRNVVLIVVSCAMMAAVLYYGNLVLAEELMNSGLLSRIGSVLSLVLIAALAYFSMVIATGALPARQLVRMIRRN